MGVCTKFIKLKIKGILRVQKRILVACIYVLNKFYIFLGNNLILQKKLFLARCTDKQRPTAFFWTPLRTSWTKLVQKLRTKIQTHYGRKLKNCCAITRTCIMGYCNKKLFLCNFTINICPFGHLDFNIYVKYIK